MALLPSWHSIWVYPQHETALGWNTWRVPVLELLRGSNAAWQPADRLLVLIGFPLTVGWVTAIEIGLPFLIFAAWWMYRLAKTTPLFASSLEAMLGWQPVLFLFLTILL